MIKFPLVYIYIIVIASISCSVEKNCVCKNVKNKYYSIYQTKFMIDNKYIYYFELNDGVMYTKSFSSIFYPYFYFTHNKNGIDIYGIFNENKRLVMSKAGAMLLDTSSQDINFTLKNKIYHAKNKDTIYVLEQNLSYGHFWVIFLGKRTNFFDFYLVSKDNNSNKKKIYSSYSMGCYYNEYTKDYEVTSDSILCIRTLYKKKTTNLRDVSNLIELPTCCP